MSRIFYSLAQQIAISREHHTLPALSDADCQVPTLTFQEHDFLVFARIVLSPFSDGRETPLRWTLPLLPPIQFPWLDNFSASSDFWQRVSSSD